MEKKLKNTKKNTPKKEGAGSKPASKDSEKEAVKGVYIFLGLLIAVVAFAVLFPFFRNQLNHFEFQGLAFTKTKFGEIPVYYYYYNFKDASNAIYKYNLYLRVDPRKNEVPVFGEIVYPGLKKRVYASLNFSKEFICGNSSRDLLTLGMFLAGNLYDVKSGVVNKTLAKETNQTYVDCESKSNSMVIVLENGEKTQILKVNDNCYYIYVSDCPSLLYAVEKFEVQSLIDAKKRILSTR